MKQMKAVAEICREALASRDRMSGTAGRIVVTVVVVLAIVIARIRRIEAGVIRPLMISGGSEASITPLCVGGFAAMRALSTRNQEPELNTAAGSSVGTAIPIV